MYGILLLFILLLLLVLNEFIYIFKGGKKQENFSNKRKTHRLSVKLANTPYQRRVGLMFRKEPLLEGHGLLFDYKGFTDATFWMKNTYIPLDILFLSANKVILDYSENNKPLDLRTISSKVKYRYAIELNGGTINKLKMKIGDKIKIKLSAYNN